MRDERVFPFNARAEYPGADKGIVRFANRPEMPDVPHHEVQVRAAEIREAAEAARALPDPAANVPTEPAGVPTKPERRKPKPDVTIQ